MEKKREKYSGGLSWKVLNLSGFGDFGFTLFVDVELYYWSAFLTDYAKFTLATATFILTLTSIIDCIWVPVTGWLIEKCNFRWGKYRSWLVIGPPIMIFAYALEFSRISQSTALAAGIVIIGFSVKTLAQDLAYSASVSLVSDMSNDQRERMILASRRGVYLSLGNIIFSLIALPLITFMIRTTGQDVLGYSLAAAIFGIMNFICYFVTFTVTKGVSISGSAGGEETEKKKKLSTLEMFKALIKNPPLLVLLSADSFRYLANFLMAAAGYYYFIIVLGNLPAMTTYLVITRFAGFLGSLIANTFVQKVGKKVSYLITTAIMAVSLVFCFIVGANLWIFIILQVIVNIFMQISMPCVTAILADTVIYYQWKTGKDARGFIMSMLNVPIKVGAILRSVILGAGLAAAGYVAGAEATPSMVRGVSAVMNLYPAVFMAIGLVIFGLGYHLSSKRIDEMTKEIEER